MNSDSEPKWACPIDCPHQSDDSLLTHSQAWFRQYRMFFLVSIAIGMMSFAIVSQEKRRPTNTEFISGLLLIVVSLEKPALLAELAAKHLNLDKKL